MLEERSQNSLKSVKIGCWNFQNKFIISITVSKEWITLNWQQKQQQNKQTNKKHSKSRPERESLVQRSTHWAIPADDDLGTK